MTLSPSSAPVDVLVVGGGMYVTGKGSQTAGTIGPALLEGRRRGVVGSIAIVTTSVDSAQDAANRMAELGDQMGVPGHCQVLDGSAGIERALADTQAQAALVAVPDHLHASLTCPLLQRGLHCLVVKPMAQSLDEALRMARAAEEAGVLGEVEFHKRLDESNLMMRDAVGNGSLGSLLYASIEYSQQKRIPRDVFAAWAARSNIFQYLGVHYVDLLQFVTGFTPRQVSAWGQKDYLASLGIDTCDSMQVVIEWSRPDGGTFVSTHISNWIDPDSGSALSDQAINLVGTAGRYQSDQKRRGVELVLDGKGVGQPNPYFSASWHNALDKTLRFSGYGIRSVLQFIDDVMDLQDGRRSLEDFEHVRPTFRQCLISTAVVDAANQSLQCGHSVPVVFP